MKILFLLIFFLSSVCWAQTAAPVDPYGAPVVLKKGPNKGKTLDISKRRPIVILHGAEAEVAHPGPGDTVVANFYSEGKFWIAKIPADAVQDVIVQMEHFPAIVPAGHIQGRFVLKPGKTIELFPQVGTDPPKQKFLTDITVSTEAVEVPPEQFDVIKGLMNHFGEAVRFLSTQSSYHDKVTLSKHLVEQFKLNITDAEKQKMLAQAIRVSNDRGWSKMYNTIIRSCSTVWFHVIMDKSIHYPWNRKLAEVLGVLPTNAKTYLKLRGLLNAGSMIPDFQSEFEPGTERPAPPKKNFVDCLIKLIPGK